MIYILNFRINIEHKHNGKNKSLKLIHKYLRLIDQETDNTKIERSSIN